LRQDRRFDRRRHVIFSRVVREAPAAFSQTSGASVRCTWGGFGWAGLGKESPNAHTDGGEYMIGLLWTIIVILFLLWIVGFFVVHIGGGLIHILLLVVLVLIVFNLITGRGAKV
jgi:hypothetical protein